MKNMLFKLWVLWYYLQYRQNQWSNRAKMIAWQERQIKRYTRFLRKKSPYYRKMLEKYGTIDQIPVVSKSEYMAHFSQINTLGISWEDASKVAMKAEENRDFSPAINGTTVGMSSGTSGNRGLFLVSPRERAQWVAAILTYVIPLSFSRRKVGFFLRSGSQLYASVQSSILAFNYYDLSRSFPELLQALEAQQPDILVAQPAVLNRIATEMEAGKLLIKPTQVISVAELLEPDIRSRLQGIFGLRIDEVYQCTEGFLASSCSSGNLHFHESFIKVEPLWLDESKTRFHPIISDFTRRSQPVIRYELNDIIHPLAAPCPCGRCTLAIKHIEGRQDDMLVFQKKATGQLVLVFPDFIRRLFIINTAYAHIDNYQLIQQDTTVLHIHVETRLETQEEIKSALLDIFSQYCDEKELVFPKIIFFDKIPYLPMEKFRRIKRNFQAPPNISHL